MKLVSVTEIVGQDHLELEVRHDAPYTLGSLQTIAGNLVQLNSTVDGSSTFIKIAGATGAVRNHFEMTYDSKIGNSDEGKIRDRDVTNRVTAFVHGQLWNSNQLPIDHEIIPIWLIQFIGFDPTFLILTRHRETDAFVSSGPST